MGRRIRSMFALAKKSTGMWIWGIDAFRKLAMPWLCQHQHIPGVFLKISSPIHIYLFSCISSLPFIKEYSALWRKTFTFRNTAAAQRKPGITGHSKMHLESIALVCILGGFGIALFLRFFFCLAQLLGFLSKYFHQCSCGNKKKESRSAFPKYGFNWPAF